ncbi:MAG: rhamnulokinase, partial [Anaerolineae bacterium]|nr:rhamnulokinase [Anaerolineae bacterium]
YEANITNEGGVENTTRFLKNVAGMWLVQQSVQTWENQGKKYTYEQMADMANAAMPFSAFIDPDDPIFLPAGDMPARIVEFCQRTGQPVPESDGQILRTIYESLALKYRSVLEQLLQLTGRRVDCLHIIGGGSQNALLCQMTANAIGREVIAGPTEATALGNGIVQWITLGELASVAQARELLSRTLETRRYTPQQNWDTAYAQFKGIL